MSDGAEWRFDADIRADGALPWDPTRDDRAPATFAVHDEGDGLSSLYLAPLASEVVAAICGRLGVAAVADVSGPRAVPMAVDAIASATHPLELVAAADPDAVPHGLDVLATPHRAVPPHGRHRFAVSIQDGAHGVIFTREPGVLVEAARAFLEAQIAAATGGQAPPPIADEALLPLLEPLPDEQWREAQLLRKRRYWILALFTVCVDGTRRFRPVDQIRWVGGPGRAWRDGWSW